MRHKKFSEFWEEKVLSEGVSPLDRKVEGILGIKVPEDNYHRKVYYSLHSILERERGVSEKDFARQDEIMQEADGIVRGEDEFVRESERKQLRPELCAELIYHKLSGKAS